MEMEIYTDGSSKNQEGGYGIVLKKDRIFSISGKVPGKSTNQRAELYAVFKALSLFKEEPVDLYTDSKYVIGCCTEWHHNWRKNNWKNAQGKPISNKELIFDILTLLEERNVKFHHVFGHRGDKYNEMADKLAERGRLQS